MTASRFWISFASCCTLFFSSGSAGVATAPSISVVRTPTVAITAILTNPARTLTHHILPPQPTADFGYVNKSVIHHQLFGFGLQSIWRFLSIDTLNDKSHMSHCLSIVYPHSLEFIPCHGPVSPGRISEQNSIA